LKVFEQGSSRIIVVFWETQSECFIKTKEKKKAGSFSERFLLSMARGPLRGREKGYFEAELHDLAADGHRWLESERN
jgi:hypothetical protein